MNDGWGESKRDLMNAKAEVIRKMVTELNSMILDATQSGLVVEIDTIDMNMIGKNPFPAVTSKVYLPL
ncbi:hypothetical protein RCXUPER_171 [Rhodobacter phage RcXuper]|nr:hypothetical protein RCXUPER_171 [Rhodobacter phage RcXuper]